MRPSGVASDQATGPNKWRNSYLILIPLLSRITSVLQTGSDQIEWLLFTGFNEENVLSLFFVIVS